MFLSKIFTKKIINNNYHKFLNLPVSPGIDLFSRTDYDPLFYRHLNINIEEISIELNNFLLSIGITVEVLEAFYTPPFGGKIPIHTDTPEICNVAKINWTYGAPGSKLLFWEIKDSKYIESFSTEYNNTYLTSKEKYCKKMFEVEITKPSLINVGQFHSTYNPTDEGRWTLSLPLLDVKNNRRITWDEALILLKDYIE